MRQVPALGMCRQPLATSQESSVQGRWSLQSMVLPPPAHLPATQVLAALHRRSLQAWAWQLPPSLAGLHWAVLVAGVQASQGLSGLACPLE